MTKEKARIDMGSGYHESRVKKSEWEIGGEVEKMSCRGDGIYTDLDNNEATDMVPGTGGQT